MLVKTEGATMNGQASETGNIGYIRHNMCGTTLHSNKHK